MPYILHIFKLTWLTSSLLTYVSITNIINVHVCEGMEETWPLEERSLAAQNISGFIIFNYELYALSRTALINLLIPRAKLMIRGQSEGQVGHQVQDSMPGLQRLSGSSCWDWGARTLSCLC